MEQLKHQWTSDDIVLIGLIVGAICAELVVTSVAIAMVMLAYHILLGR